MKFLVTGLENFKSYDKLKSLSQILCTDMPYYCKQGKIHWAKL